MSFPPEPHARWHGLTGTRGEHGQSPFVRQTVEEKTNMKRGCISLGFTVLVACTPIPAIERVASASESHLAKVSLVDARTKALSLVPGKVIDEELEHEGGRWIYSFEIKPTGEKRKLIKEVNIDADTGAVVGIEVEKS